MTRMKELEFKKNKADAKKFRTRNFIYVLFVIGFIIVNK